MRERTDYGGLDAFRVAAAILVVAIHTSPLSSFSGSADFFLTRVLARIAVPFFLMVTGQFILSDVVYRRTRSLSPLWRYLRKVLVLYAVAILLYLPLGIYAGHYQAIDGFAVVRMLLFDGTFYHLWYFPACIIGVLLLALLSRRMGLRGMAVTAGVLYLLGLLGDSYFGLTQQLPVLERVYEWGFHLWSYTRNGLFFAPVYLLLGTVIGAQKRPMPIRWAALGGIISFAVMTAEAFALRAAQWQKHDSMYLMLLPVMYFLYQLLLALPWRSRRTLRTAATWIYILHPFVIVLVRGAAKISRLSVLVDNSLVHYLAVLALSFAVAAVITAGLSQKPGNPCPSGRAWIELDRSALKNNVQFLQSMLPERCQLMPAVKANAYGHGMISMAKELQKLGVHAFCVACIQEGIQLRKAGIQGEILILGYTHPEQLDLLRRYHLTQTVVDISYARKLRKYGKPLHVHIGIDTGMHRLGERSENIEQICSMFQIRNLIVEGMFTHLSASDTLDAADKIFTEHQIREFYHIVEELKSRGIPVPKLHLQASYGILNYPELSGDYARVGIALYGVLSTAVDTTRWRDKLRPVLSLKARVASVRTIYPGESAGYGLQFSASHPMKIAVLTIGYADGLPRSLSYGTGSVLIGGKRAAIIGRICMDQTLIDVTDIPNIRPGDVAVLIGRSGHLEISACDLAEQAGTITNEILSRLGARLENVQKGQH